MGGGTVKVDSPKRRGRARGKTVDTNIFSTLAFANYFVLINFSTCGDKYFYNFFNVDA